MRYAFVLAALLVSTPARATQRSAILSVGGCAPLGPGQGSYGLLAQRLYLGLGWDVGNVLYTDPGSSFSVVYLCDADLPPTATGFDYALFEYVGGTVESPPWVVAYLNADAVDAWGRRNNWVQEIGSCGGEVTVSGPQTPEYDSSITVCQTSGSADWSAARAQAQQQALSVFFLVFMPAGPPTAFGGGGYWGDGLVCRLIEFYEE